MGYVISPAGRLPYALRRNHMVRNSTDLDLMRDWRADLDALGRETRWPAWRRAIMRLAFGIEAGTKALTGLEVSRITRLAGKALPKPVEDTAFHTLPYQAFSRLMAAAEHRMGDGEE